MENTTPNQNEDLNEEVSKDEVKKEFGDAWGSLKKFLRELLDIRSNTDQKATIEAIVADIPFKGHTSWILVCSIFIASVGLNANSTAVVIGAMLISPLMGPILGMGMSLAINDIDTLRRSVKNFLVMVVLSILTAFLFFYVFPVIGDNPSELLARTKPDIRDVLIAFFGGLALVIARAKKGTIASVIFGVAIATALMPPLCTVGFGLAIGRFDFAIGAMYLFLINTIFIGLATFLVLKLLRFPMVRYANSAKRRFIARVASLVGLVMMIPAGYIFYNALQESRFDSALNTFINDYVKTYKFSKGGRYVDDLSEKDYNGGEPIIELVFVGNEGIPETVEDTWKSQIAQSSNGALSKAKLTIFQGGRDDNQERLEYITELYQDKKAQLSSKEAQIQLLEDEVAELSKLKDEVDFEAVISEAKINYEDLKEMGYARLVKSNFSKMDTTLLFTVKWKDSMDISKSFAEQRKLKKWLETRLKKDSIVIQRD
ncbi:DUF389 domain-containing protein [Spongiivirga citrea]|uniref:DUF389 domain-containing protein n=1 Tax=Spongiivirga citrea TaxID=1481457 RepID=A0A6M0CK88_9FLAO|nr:DUF389 domain-containing protein [Spongiivirga citrea]NER18355.1 DUF389 domain-containing protein [Spongiivirga citrea]